jgi:hypothetical protein
MTASTYFSPYQNVITNITNSNPAIITTYSDNGFLPGLVVRFFLPKQSGMSDLNFQVAEISVLGRQTFSVPINTTAFDPFIPPSLPIAGNAQLPQVLPIGEDALTLINATQNNGSISPEYGIKT